MSIRVEAAGQLRQYAVHGEEGKLNLHPVQRSKEAERIMDGLVLERKLVIPGIIIVVQVCAPIMHGEEIQEGQAFIQPLVFPEMFHQNRQFGKLNYRQVVERNRQQYHI